MDIGAAVSALAASIRNIDGRLRALANSEPKLQAWQSPTLAGVWANSGGAYATAGYWKDPYGVVHLRGRVAGGAFPSTIFTLPAGYLPAATQSFTVPTGAVVDVAASGIITAISGSSYVALDSITFRAAG